MKKTQTFQQRQYWKRKGLKLESNSPPSSLTNASSFNSVRIKLERKDLIIKELQKEIQTLKNEKRKTKANKIKIE